MHELCDVAVVGGGTTGCSITWHLARAGARVILVERGAIAEGASGDSPGIVRQYYADTMLATLAAAGLRAYAAWGATVGGDCGWRRTGFLTAVAPDMQTRVREDIECQRALGVDVRWMPADELRALIPDFFAVGVAGAVHEPSAGYCNARATAQGYALAAATIGAKIRTRCTAVAIRVAAGRVVGLETDGGLLDCPVVVNAAGPWAAALAATCAAPLPIRATRQFVTVVRLADGESPGATLPGYSDRAAGFYLRPDAAGSYLIGALECREGTPIDPDRREPRPSPEEASRLAARAGVRFSRLRDAVPQEARISFFDETPDGNPLVGADPRVSGLFVAAGLSGHGFKFAPVFGSAIASHVVTNRSHPDLASLQVGRLFHASC